MVDEVFIRKRITELRLRKNVSEYKMSRDLGHSNGYIQGIVSGKALPRMGEFLSICDYLEVTPAEFFSEGEADLTRYKGILTSLRKLPEQKLKLLEDLAANLVETK